MADHCFPPRRDESTKSKDGVQNTVVEYVRSDAPTHGLTREAFSTLRISDIVSLQAPVTEPPVS